jgi:hypothetical protein
MTQVTKCLNVVQAVRHFEVGKAVDRDDMVRVRGLGGNRDPAATATKAVADQCLPLEVSAAWPGTFAEDNSGLPFVVFQVRVVGTGFIRLW